MFLAGLVATTVICASNCLGSQASNAEDSLTPVFAHREIEVKLGVLIDAKSKHLTDELHHALDRYKLHPSENDSPEAGKTVNGSSDSFSFNITFDPVISYVDISDSFAVSNAMCSLIAHDVTAILGITNASSLPTIQSYSSTFNVPFLSLGSTQNLSSSAPFQLSLRPPFMAAIVDVLRYHECVLSLYVYDSDEGLMRIQDLFHAINIRDIMIELDVRRVGDTDHVSEISNVICSLKPERSICLLLDLERIEITKVIASLTKETTTMKDVIIVTLDAALILRSAVTATGWKTHSFNLSALQVTLPQSNDVTTHYSAVDTENNRLGTTYYTEDATSHDNPILYISDALILDSLQVLSTAIRDVIDDIGDIFSNSGDVSPADKSMRCTNFVVEKQKYGDTLMKSLRLVKMYGNTGYISFDASGKREAFNLDLYKIYAGKDLAEKAGHWSLLSGLSVQTLSGNEIRTYLILGNSTSVTREKSSSF